MKTLSATIIILLLVSTVYAGEILGKGKVSEIRICKEFVSGEQRDFTRVVVKLADGKGVYGDLDHHNEGWRVFAEALLSIAEASRETGGKLTIEQLPGPFYGAGTICDCPDIYNPTHKAVYFTPKKKK